MRRTKGRLLHHAAITRQRHVAVRVLDQTSETVSETGVATRGVVRLHGSHSARQCWFETGFKPPNPFLDPGMSWKETVERLLSELKSIDFGYPLGDNCISQPVPDSSVNCDDRLEASVLKELQSFYAACDGFSWPDMQNGYFVKPQREIGVVKDEYEPVRIAGSIECDILSLGSSGTGTLFAVARDGKVLAMPAGRIERNTYCDDSNKARVVAAGLGAFFELLASDLEAFVADDPGHTYVE